MDRSFNQAIDKILEFCEAHPMLRQSEFTTNALTDIDTDQISFPYMYVSVDPSTIQKWGLQLNIILTCMDQMSEDGSNTKEILSDTLQIIQDIITKLDDIDSVDFQINIENSFSVNPFEYRFKSMCAGWWCTIQIQMAYPMGLCDNPIE